jgi:hypothetical protein
MQPTAAKSRRNKNNKKEKYIQYPTLMEAMASAEQSSRFVFVNGSALVSAGTRDERRRVRSQLMRRIYRERQELRQQSSKLSDPKYYELVGVLSGCLCRDDDRPHTSKRELEFRRWLQDLRLESGDSDNTSQQSPPLLPTPKPTITKDSGTVCNRCGKPVLDSKWDIKAWKRIQTSKTKLTSTGTVYSPLARCVSAEFDPFGGPASSRNYPGYSELLDHCRFKFDPGS